MTDETKPQEPVPCRLIILFAGEGMAEATIIPEGPVTLGQIYGAAWLLEADAREVRDQQVEDMKKSMQNSQRIVIPMDHQRRKQ